MPTHQRPYRRAQLLTNCPYPASCAAAAAAVVIEERHGFNKQTKALFFMDLLKSALLGLVVLPPLVAMFTWLLQHAGPWMPLQLWAFVFGVAILIMTIYPTCKAPAGPGQ